MIMNHEIKPSANNMMTISVEEEYPSKHLQEKIVKRYSKNVNVKYGEIHEQQKFIDVMKETLTGKQFELI